MKVHRISPESAADGGTANFTGGPVQVQMIVSPEEGLDIIIVRFSPGARTYLHAHHGPQVLHCMEGRGILATEHERNEVGPGDVVYVPANEMHWHGAAPDSEFVHMSIRTTPETTWTQTDPLA